MSISNQNLDLSTTDDLDQAAQKIEDFYKSDTSAKTALSYNWERNQLFLDGRQWLVYDGERGAGGQWRTLSVSRANEYIPRPVTNYSFDAYQTLKAYLVQHRPRSTVTPNTQTYRDKQAAKIANLCLEANWERLKDEKNYEYAASCGVTYGTVFKKDYWDATTLSMAKIPRVMEQPITDPMTGAVVGYQEAEVIDPQTGEVVMDEIPLGDVSTGVVEPYRISLDPLCSDLHNARWIMEFSIQPLDWIIEQFDRQEEGYTGRASEVKPEQTLSTSLRRFYDLKQSSGVKYNQNIGPGSGAASGEAIENTAVVKEYYERPSRKYPKGRLVVVANGIPLYGGASPCDGPELGDWHPYSEFRWEVIPGRFWGRAPLDDITELNKQVNSIDSVIMLTRKTMAVPQKIIPSDSGIAPGVWTGRPGQEIRPRSTGAMPSVVQSAGVHEQVFAERKQKVEDIKQISGAIDILKGDRPPGVTAASALEMLYEVGTGKLKPVLDRWKMFIESSQKKQLRLMSKKYREPRPEFIRLLHMKNKEIPESAINQFIGSDLLDNCNVCIEAGSNVPKLQSVEKSLLLQLANIGTLNLASPENQMEFNKRMGIAGFEGDTGPDVKRAEWENDMLDSIEVSPSNQPVILADDNHAIHKDIHTRRMKEPSFITLSPAIQQAYMQHIEQHQQILDQQAQIAMMQGMPAAPQSPPQTPPMPAGKGISQSHAEKVIGSEVPKI